MVSALAPSLRLNRKGSTDKRHTVQTGGAAFPAAHSGLSRRLALNRNDHKGLASAKPLIFLNEIYAFRVFFQTTHWIFFKKPIPTPSHIPFSKQSLQKK